MAKRKARKLLKATALAAGTMLAGCGSQANEEYTEPPGNPKGSGYDDEVVQTDMTQNEGVESDAEGEGEGDGDESPPDMTPQPDPLPLPANPKGSGYDDGVVTPPPTPEE